jgi:hypothetical protein
MTWSTMAWPWPRTNKTQTKPKQTNKQTMATNEDNIDNNPVSDDDSDSDGDDHIAPAEDTLESIASELAALKAGQKAFKKENKELFKENTRLNRTAKQLSDKLIAKMTEDGMETHECDGMLFSVKTTVVNKHDEDALEHAMGDKYQDYIKQVQTQKPEVRTRNAPKRKRTE